MSTISRVNDKENTNKYVCRPKRKTVKQPFNEIQTNIKLRSRSTSSVSKTCSVKSNGLEIINGKDNSPKTPPKSANDSLTQVRNFSFDFVQNSDNAKKSTDFSDRNRDQKLTTDPKSNNKGKTKLKKNSEKTTSSPKLSYAEDVYSLEYIEDIIKIALENERKFVLDSNFMELMRHNHEHRTFTVKWIQSLRDHVKITSNVFYLAVNLLDQILAKSPVSVLQYHQVLLCNIRIAYKLIGDRDQNVPIFRMSAEDCNPQVWINWEYGILKLLNFNLHTIEPTMFVAYFMDKIEIIEHPLANITVQKLIDLLTHYPEFSMYRCSVIAAAAVEVTLKLHFQKNRYRIDLVFRKIFNKDDMRLKNNLVIQLMELHRAAK